LELNNKDRTVKSAEQKFLPRPGSAAAKIFSGVAVSLLVATAAWAYIPPALFIIKNMASKRSGVRSVRIMSQVTSFESGKPSSHHFKMITVYDPQTQILHSQVLDASGTELFGMEKNGESMPLLVRVLYDPSARDIVAALKRADIPVNVGEEGGAETSSLHRWNGSLAWVLGIFSKDKPGSQLWIEKDSFLPVRLIAGDQDYQFTKYRYAQALAYPRLIALVNRAGTLLFQEEIQDVRVNPALRPEEVSVAKGFTESGKASSERDLIQKYYDGLH
jgi:hypothetical protein